MTQRDKTESKEKATKLVEKIKQLPEKAIPSVESLIDGINIGLQLAEAKEKQTPPK